MRDHTRAEIRMAKDENGNGGCSAGTASQLDRVVAIAQAIVALIMRTKTTGCEQ